MIDHNSDPITGSWRQGDAEPQGFCGWIELVEAIEQVRHSGNGAEAETGAGDLGNGATKS